MARLWGNWIRSAVLLVNAVLMNLLTLSAAFDVLVLIFQDGRLENLLQYTSQGAQIVEPALWKPDPLQQLLGGLLPSLPCSPDPPR